MPLLAYSVTTQNVRQTATVTVSGSDQIHRIVDRTLDNSGTSVREFAIEKKETDANGDPRWVEVLAVNDESNSGDVKVSAKLLVEVFKEVYGS